MYATKEDVLVAIHRYDVWPEELLGEMFWYTYNRVLAPLEKQMRRFDDERVAHSIVETWFSHELKVPRCRRREYLRSLILQVIDAELSRIGVRYA
jgi:hypothetical protein